MEKFVTIVNTDPEEPFIGKYDGEYLTIPAGGSKVVPEDVMFVWMGNPAVEDTVRDPERRHVYNRLCTLWHAQELTGNIPELLPKIEAYDDEGNRIITVIDDPLGESLLPDAEEPSDIGRLQRQIAKLEAQMAERVQGLVDSPENAPDNDSDTPDVGGRSAGTEGVLAEEIDRERAVDRGEDPDEVTGSTDDDLDIPSDSPTKVPVGKAKPTPRVTPPAKKVAAKKATAKKAPPSKPRGTAGTAGRRRAPTAK